MATWRLWPSTSGPAITNNNASTDLGVQFKVNAPAQIDGYFYWLPAAAVTTTGTSYSFRLYSTTNGTTGTLIGSTTVTGSGTWTAGAWNYAPLGTPVVLTSGTTYTAVCTYSAGSNHYGATASYWSSGGGASGITAGPITAPGTSTALNGASSLFNEPSTGGFPASSSGGTNYWVDVQVEDLACRSRRCCRSRGRGAGGTGTGGRRPCRWSPRRPG